MFQDRSWGDHWEEAIGDKMELNPHIPKPDPPKEEPKVEEAKDNKEEEKKEEEKEKVNSKFHVWLINTQATFSNLFNTWPDSS